MKQTITLPPGGERFIRMQYTVTSSGATSGHVVFSDHLEGGPRHPGLAAWVLRSQCPRAIAIRNGASPRPKRT